ncbi:MAG: hemolysin family protein [Bacillota bacterium]|nr:hemolysin family protein [Bacillota bacterium]
MLSSWSILIVIIVLAISAYVAAVERALSSVNKITVRTLAEGGDTRATDLLDIIEDPGTYMLALRSCIVLLHAVVCIIALYGFFGLVEKEAAALSPWEGQGNAVLALIVLILLLALVLYSFCELLPRRIAVLHEEGIALAATGVVRFLLVVMKPMTAVSSGLVYLALRICRQRIEVDYNEYSEEDIVSMLETGQEKGELKEEGKKMITGVFAFDDLLAYEVMTPRTDVFAIDINDPPEDYLDELMELRYSRIPVYEDDSDNIIGILYIKDYLIQARNAGFDNVDIRSILRTPYFVPGTKNIDSLFVELQKTKQHIAILIDEYGGFSGIVTMEDIIEEVMGDIDDEYDEEEPGIQIIGKDTYRLDGSMDLDDIDEELGIDLVSESSETIGGFLIDILGEIPDEDDLNQEIPYDNYIFTINSIKDRRIEGITMKILPESDSAAEEEDTAKYG